MSNPRLKAALEYLRDRQWSVIPLHPKTKKAMVKWKPFVERRPTEAEIRDWWDHWPDANVGVVTGQISNLVVVDVDPDKGGNADAWTQSHPTALVAATGRGGTHLYYEYPENASVVRNSAGRLAPGVDLRGDGGYVAAPPSIHANGKEYAWVVEGAWPSPIELEALRHTNGGEPHVGSTEHWLERVLQGVGQGERNDACARIAGYLFKKELPKDVALAQMQAWNKLNDPPLAEGEIRQTVESVWRTARENAHKAPTFELEQSETDDPIGAYDTIRLSAYLAKYGSIPTTWLVRDWLPEQTVGMVVAPPGSYKTWLLQDLAVSVSTGMPFLGRFPVERQGPVLFMQQEDWHGQIAHRFSLIISRRANLVLPWMDRDTLHFHCPPDLPVYLHEHRRFRFDDNSIVEAWIDKVRTIRPALVILDPLYSAGSVENFMAGTAASMFLFKSIRDALGTTFLIAHHTRKTAKEKNGGGLHINDATPEREDVWGSQFLNAWIETGWQIRKREELGTATIARHFKVQSDALKTVLGFRIDTTVIPGKYEVEVREVKPGETEKGVDLVTLLEEQGPTDMHKLVRLTGLHRVTLAKRLGNLQKAEVVALIGGKYHLRSSLEVQNG